MRRNATRKFAKTKIARAGPPIQQAAPKLPANGYTMVVDGQMKTEFKTEEAALSSAVPLKRRFPALLVQVFDAQGGAAFF